MIVGLCRGRREPFTYLRIHDQILFNISGTVSIFMDAPRKNLLFLARYSDQTLLKFDHFLPRIDTLLESTIPSKVFLNIVSM
jgi:hypothetical protein